LAYSSTDLNVESGYWQASKNYKENEAIMISGVEKRPLVKIGDVFQGVLKSGQVTISIKLKALEKGFINNTIKAERSNSNKVLNVRLQLDKFKRIFGVIE
jgi:flagella basal body P-ring formation protein FlgA